MSTTLVLTGTEAAGKSSIADALAAANRAVNVIAVTTRAERDDDQGRYRYLSKEEFTERQAGGELLISTTYRSEDYGILSSDLEDARATGMTPILTLTPHSVRDFLVSQGEAVGIVTVFVDAEDEALDERILARGETPDLERRWRDRAIRDVATYRVVNTKIDKSVAAIEMLLRGSSRSGVLPHQWLATLLEAGLLLTDFNLDNVQAASYDLSLGDEYFYGGRIKRLSQSQPILTIAPYDYAIVTSRERACLPRDMIGRFDLSVGLFSQGIILSNGPQIDPGFEGNLFCLLFNTSSSPVLLRRGHHYATLEIAKIMEASAQPYSGARQGKGSILDYLPSNAAQGAINELKKEVEQLRKESSRLQTFFIAAISLMFAVSALLAAAR